MCENLSLDKYPPIYYELIYYYCVPIEFLISAAEHLSKTMISLSHETMQNNNISIVDYESDQSTVIKKNSNLFSKFTK